MASASPSKRREMDVMKLSEFWEAPLRSMQLFKRDQRLPAFRGSCATEKRYELSSKLHATSRQHFTDTGILCHCDTLCSDD